MTTVVLPAGIKLKRLIKEKTGTKKALITKLTPSNQTTKFSNEDNETQKIIRKLSKPGVRIKKVNTSGEKSNKDGDDNEEEDSQEDPSDEDYIPKQTKNKSGKKNLETKKTEKQESVMLFKKISYVCVMCGESFPTFEILSEHMKSPVSCKQEQSVVCPICEKSFKNRSRCNAHINTHKEKPKYPCKNCGKEFPNTIALQAHLETMHTPYFDATLDAFACKLCNKEAPTKQRILNHINTNHYRISTFLCDICGKSFWKESSLRAHTLIHTDSKPYMCQICSKSFKLPSSLRAHIQTHSQERRFICDECGKTFKKNTSLMEHKKHHAGHFPFQCDICKKRFVSKSAQSTHMKSHTYTSDIKNT